MLNKESTKGRATAIAAAVSVTAATWVLAEPVLGFELRGPAQQGGAATHDVNAVVVAVASLVASGAGWVLLALLERFVPRHARRVWTAAAVAVLVLSLGGPLSGAGITAANKVWLAVMHLTVGATLIPLMRRTAHQGAGPSPRGSAAAPVTTDRAKVGGESR